MSVSEQMLVTLKWMSPALVLLLGGCLVLCSSVFLSPVKSTSVDNRRNLMASISMFFLVVAAIFHLLVTRHISTNTIDSGLFRFDSISSAAERLALIGGVILILLSWSLAPKNYLPEFYGCLLLILAAIPIIGAANDLIAMFLALELVSIPTYIMLSIAKGDNASFEAALKYFTLSGFASCFFLLGISYLYGLSGSMDLGSVYAMLGNGGGGKLGLLAVLLMMSGLAFRITAVPFHFYGPDVFEGTSLTMAAVMSYLPKVAGFVAMVRLFGATPVGESLAPMVVPVLLVTAVLTMCIGNALAVSQTSVRRLLGYSSIAHTGYLLLGFAALILSSAEPQVLFTYLAAYAAMTLGVFACLAEFDEAGGQSIVVGDLSGMYYRRPAASIAMSICLLSLIGLPLTAGFVAKLQLFFAAGGANRWDMTVCVWVMAINAAVAAGYYFRLLSKLFERGLDLPPLRLWRPSLFLAYSLCAVLTIVWFFQPTSM